jgi:hypothetical protein
VLIGSLQEVKMLGLSDIVTNMIQNLRVKELDLSKQYRRLLAIQTFIGRHLSFGPLLFRVFNVSSWRCC